MEPLGLYVHIPFCVRRCGYCDFATIAGEDERIPAYFDTLGREISARAARLSPGKRRADTIFLGGGTPSHVPPGNIAAILGRLRAEFDLDAGAEITLEANPESTSEEKAGAWRAAGVNRVSIGVQSFEEEELLLLDRAHDPEGAARAVRAIRSAGIENLNLDLMAGLPGQTRRSLRGSLDAAIRLEPDHISAYLLETDKPTPLARRVGRGEIDLPAEEEAAGMYEDLRAVLAAAGFVHYEISNWCRPGREARHNLKYWTSAPYLGFGLGAHSFLGDERRANPRSIEAWSRAVGGGADPSAPAGPPGAAARLEEAAFTGLRLLAGIDLAAFRARHGQGLLETFGARLLPSLDAGLLESDGRILRLTEKGLLLSNEVFEAILDAEIPA